MRRYIAFLTIALLPLAANAGFFTDDVPDTTIPAGQASFETAFAPKESMSALAVKEIASAKSSIRLSARTFLSKPVSDALVKAKRAGVDVKVVVNKKTNSGVDSAARFMTIMSMPPRIAQGDDALFASYMIVDDHDIVLGNIADLTDEQDEKSVTAYVTVIHNAPDLARRYVAQWQPLWNSGVEMKDSGGSSGQGHTAATPEHGDNGKKTQ